MDDMTAINSIQSLKTAASLKFTFLPTKPGGRSNPDAMKVGGKPQGSAESLMQEFLGQ